VSAAPARSPFGLCLLVSGLGRKGINVKSKEVKNLKKEKKRKRLCSGV
jgi:hypothetical protein